MKKIIILNGAEKKNGHTKALIDAFTEGATAAGNEVKEYYLYGMGIHGCLDCQGCVKNKDNPAITCVQNDDMTGIYAGFLAADVIVFASPVYWWAITGTLKTAVDRLYALTRKYGIPSLQKKTILLMTAGIDEYSHPLAWYAGFEKYMNWENLGTILGASKTKEAKELGATIK